MRLLPPPPGVTRASGSLMAFAAIGCHHLTGVGAAETRNGASAHIFNGLTGPTTSFANFGAGAAYGHMLRR